MNALTTHFPIIADPDQLSGVGPFTLSCVGEVTAHAPDLGSYPQQVTVLLGRFRCFAEAFACAKRRGRQADLCIDTLSGFMLNLLVIEDSRKRLCLAGQIAQAGLIWCDPVASDTEARQVVLEACQIAGYAGNGSGRSGQGENPAFPRHRIGSPAGRSRLAQPAA